MTMPRNKRHLVVISGYYGFGNLGDEAILEELINELKQFVPKDCIVVASANPSETQNKYSVRAVSRTNFVQLRRILQQSILLISGGGGLFQDTRGPGSALFYALHIALAVASGAQVAIYAQGIGPLNSLLAKVITRYAFSLAQSISVRDEKSLQLVFSWGLKAEKTADPVWCLKPTPLPDSIEKVLGNPTFAHEEKPLLVGISLRPSTNFLDSDLENLIDVLAKHLPNGCHLILLPLQESQDRPILEKLNSKWHEYGKTSKIIDTNRLYLPSQWITLFSRLDFLISMRLHALIMALKSNVPCLGIAYDPKVSSLLTEFDQPILNLTKEKDKAYWTSHLQSAFSRRAELSRQASLKVQIAQELACQNIKLISRILEMSTLSTTNKSRQTVLGYPVDLVDEPLALEVIESAWRQQKRLQIVTLNAEMVVAAQQDSELDRIIRHAHLIIPDGAGIVWALRLAGKIVDRLAGIDLAMATLHRAAIAGRTVALVGGKPEVMERVVESLPKMHPGLKITYHHHGYFTPEQEAQLIEEMAKTDPELVLIGLGVPKQEYFIDRWGSCLPHSVLIGIGGSLDIWAGASKRAPKLLQRIHLEWLYRLVTEPWRWRRIGSALPNFGWQVLWQRFLSKQNHNHSSKNS